MADDQKLSTSDLAGRTKPDDARRRQDAPTNEPLEERASDQQRRLDDERKQDRAQSGNGVRGAGEPVDGDKTTPLLEGDAADHLAEQWTEIQVDFVDRPRDAVSRADELVAQVMQQLAARFADERNNLESQWSSGDDVDTEDLRVALQRYRSFFQRLLHA